MRRSLPFQNQIENKSKLVRELIYARQEYKAYLTKHWAGNQGQLFTLQTAGKIQ